MPDPGGYVVITFGAEGDEAERVCGLNRCPMDAVWFAGHEEAEQYMARMPGWTEPHRLPLNVPLGDAGENRPISVPRSSRADQETAPDVPPAGLEPAT